MKRLLVLAAIFPLAGCVSVESAINSGAASVQQASVTYVKPPLDTIGHAFNQITQPWMGWIGDWAWNHGIHSYSDPSKR